MCIPLNDNCGALTWVPYGCAEVSIARRAAELIAIASDSSLGPAQGSGRQHSSARAARGAAAVPA